MISQTAPRLNSRWWTRNDQALPAFSHDLPDMLFSSSITWLQVELISANETPASCTKGLCFQLWKSSNLFMFWGLILLYEYYDFIRRSQEITIYIYVHFSCTLSSFFFFRGCWFVREGDLSDVNEENQGS